MDEAKEGELGALGAGPGEVGEGDEALGVSLQVVNTSGSVETTLSYATDVRGLAAIAALAL